MKKLYKYYIEPNIFDYTPEVHGIFIENIKDEKILSNIYRSASHSGFSFAIIPKYGQLKVKLDLDPELFYTSPELFMAIFDEKVKKLEEI